MVDTGFDHLSIGIVKDLISWITLQQPKMLIREVQQTKVGLKT